MKEDDLSFVAEALLAICEKDRERPFYSSVRLEQKLRQSEMRDPLYAGMERAFGPDAILEHECQAVFSNARLTDRQRSVLQLRLAGFTFEEIGNRGGHTKQGAQSIFCQALKKITRALRVYPYRGLSDVYRMETRRKARSLAFGTLHR